MTILIGCPTYNGKAYCLSAYAQGIRESTYQDFDLMLVDNSTDDTYLNILKETFSFLGERFILKKDIRLPDPRDILVHSRNLIREHFLKKTYTHFLSLEQDVFIPSDVITRLLSHKKDIISPLMWNLTIKDERKILVPMLWEEKENHPGKIFYIHPDKIKNPGLYDVAFISLSCTLMTRQVLESLVFRREKTYDDMTFSKDARQKGFTIFADTTLCPRHFPRAKRSPTSPHPNLYRLPPGT